MDENEEIPPLEISTKLKELVPELKSLVTSLTCNICYDPFNNPVLTGCSHSFCSLCIRKYLVYKQQCPVCGADTTDGQLRSNKVASECSTNLRSLVNSLESLISSDDIKEKQHVLHTNKPIRNKIIDSDSENENFEPTPTKIKVVDRKKSQHFSPLRENNRNSIDNESSQRNDSLLYDKESKMEKPVFQPDFGLKSVKQDSSAHSQGKTECMVCKVLVPSKNLNLHLDACLNKSRALPEKPIVKRKALPKLVYNLLKDADLRKKCKELGLNSKGDRRILIKRHQKYCIIYNSECDLPNPRGKFEILRQVEREEALEKKGSNTATNPILKFDKNADTKVIEEKQRQYIHQNKTSFQQLITQARNPPNSTDSEMSSSSKISQDSLSHTDDESSQDLIIDVDNHASLSSQDSNRTPNCQTDKSSEELNIVSTPPTAIKRKLDSEMEISSKKHRLGSSPTPVGSLQTPTGSLQTPAGPSLTPAGPGLPSNDSNHQTPKDTLAKGTEFRRNSESGSKGSRSIQESLALVLSTERSKPKQECPVCHAQVTERYLNIHLDKCLRDNEPDPSPVFKKKPVSRKSNKTKGKTNLKVAAVFTTSEDDTEEEDDFSLPPSPPPRRPGVGKRKKCQAVLDIESESEGSVNLLGNEMDDSDEDFISAIDNDNSIDDEDIVSAEDHNKSVDEDTGDSSQNSSHMVMEPTLNDLLSMGLGSKADGAGLNSSLEEDSQYKQTVNNDNNDFEETFVEDEPIPSSSAYDQYTDNLSQESYYQDSDDMFEDKDDTLHVDDTISQHIEQLTDKYFDKDSPTKETGIEQELSVKKSNDQKQSAAKKSANHSSTKSIKTGGFQTAAELVDNNKKITDLLPKKKTNEKSVTSSLRKSTKTELFQTAAELMKKNKEISAAAKGESTDEEIEDKVNANAASPVNVRLTRARGRSSKKKSS